MVTNATIEALLGRRSIRKFKDEAIDDDTRATLETVAQHAASSQFLNDWSAIRITDPATKAKLAEFGHQPYIATAPLLYVFVIDEHRNARIAERKGIGPASDEFHLKYSYRFTQAQNDAVLALHAMETAAYSLGLGCVILGSLLNNIPGLIDGAESAGIHVSGAGSGHRQARSEPDRQAAHAAHDAVLREHLPG